MKIIQPYALSMVISYILGAEVVSAIEGWGWVGLLTVASLFYVVVNALAFFGEYRIGMSVRAVVSTLIYKKASMLTRFLSRSDYFICS